MAGFQAVVTQGAGGELAELRRMRSAFRWTSASCSHRGRVRKINEDACLDQSERGMWAVADGMGGHACGELASRLVVDSLIEVSSANSLAHFIHNARDRLRRANRQIRTETLIRDLPIIGSTVAVLLAWDRSCGYLWAGDSRIYLRRGGRLRLLTRDHSHAEDVRSRRDPNADETLHRLPPNLITRAVGIAETLDLEEGRIDVIDGDVFLLCTDGLSNAVHHLEIGNALLPGSCRQASEALLAMALTRGGHDNISAVVVRADDLQSSDRTATNPAL